MKDQDHTSSILKAFTPRSLSCLFFFAEDIVWAVLSSASMMGGEVVMMDAYGFSCGLRKTESKKAGGLTKQ